MTTPFDDAIEAIRKKGYHNHRLETHSDTVSDGLFSDLVRTCEPLRMDVGGGVVKVWRNVRSPGDRRRKVDLFVGAATAEGDPDIAQLRIAVENKSVVTAHRNRTNRFDDLKKVLSAIHDARPEALVVATVLVGLAERVLNVPDDVKKRYRDSPEDFARSVLPRLSSGDASLWEEFPWAISYNRVNDPAGTVAMMRTIPTRKPGHTHVQGYDFVLLVPVLIDNVNPPLVARANSLGIDVDTDYRLMLQQICAAYTARWHM